MACRRAHRRHVRSTTARESTRTPSRSNRNAWQLIDRIDGSKLVRRPRSEGRDHGTDAIGPKSATSLRCKVPPVHNGLSCGSAESSDPTVRQHAGCPGGNARTRVGIAARRPVSKGQSVPIDNEGIDWQRSLVGEVESGGDRHHCECALARGETGAPGDETAESSQRNDQANARSRHQSVPLS